MDGRCRFQIAAEFGVPRPIIYRCLDALNASITL